MNYQANKMMGKTGVPREKPLEAEQRSNKLNPHMPLSSGINPHPHGLKERALTTALTLPPPPSPNTEYTESGAFLLNNSLNSKNISIAMRTLSPALNKPGKWTTRYVLENIKYQEK